MAFSSTDLLKESLLNFRASLHAKVPPTLKYCIQFIDDQKINEVAVELKALVRKDFFSKLSNASDQDEDGVGENVSKLNREMQKLIQELVAKHKEYKAEAESLMEQRISRICLDFQTSAEERFSTNPGTTGELIKIDLGKEKIRAISYFEIWNNGNQTFFLEQKKKLEERLGQLESEILRERANETGRTPMEQHNPVIELIDLDADDMEVANVENGTSSLRQTEMHSQSVRRCERTTQNLDLPVPGTSRGTTRASTNGTASKRQHLTEAPAAGLTKSGEEDSLIFRLQSGRIEMGMLIDGCFIGRRPCDKDIMASINSILGTTWSGQLKCGLDLSEYKENQYCFLKLHQDTEVNKYKKISFNLHGQELTEEINVEFGLGLLLRTLKKSAETHQNRSFPTAIITIPTWFGSIQRIQIKDAAKIAGFGEIHLLNQESITAYAYALERLTLTQSNYVILVMSKNFQVVNLALYNWNGNILIMTESISIDCSRSSHSSLVRDVERVLSKLAVVGGVVVRKVLIPSSSLDLYNALSEVLVRFGFEFDSRITEKSMFGASILAEKTVREIRKATQECFASGICLRSPVSINGDAVSRMVHAPPFQHKCNVPIECFHEGEKLKIFQDFPVMLRSKSTKVFLGQLEFMDEEQLLSNMDELWFNIAVSSEAIVSVDVNSFKSTLKHGKAERGSFHWTTPGPSIAEMHRLCQLVSSIV